VQYVGNRIRSRHAGQDDHLPPGDVRDHLIRKGPRGLSNAINEILEKTLFQSKESLFGADTWLNTKGLRDERDPMSSRARTRGERPS